MILNCIIYKVTLFTFGHDVDMLHKVYLGSMLITVMSLIIINIFIALFNEKRLQISMKYAFPYSVKNTRYIFVNFDIIVKVFQFIIL